MTPTHSCFGDSCTYDKPPFEGIVVPEILANSSRRESGQFSSTKSRDLLSTDTIVPLLETRTVRDHIRDYEPENQIDADFAIKPLSSRRIKARKVFRRDPCLFLPPDDDDFIADLD